MFNVKENWYVCTYKCTCTRYSIVQVQVHIPYTCHVTNDIYHYIKKQQKTFL